MLHKYLVGALILLTAPMACLSQTVSVGWGNADWAVGLADSSKNLLGVGDVIRLGSFSSGTDFTSTSFSYLDSNFLEYGSARVGDGLGGGLPGFFSAEHDSSAPYSTKLYMWVFNSSTAASATEWGVFSQATAPSLGAVYSWTTGGDPLTGSRVLDLSTADTGFPGQFAAYSSPDFSMVAMTTAVPEPSTYAAILGFVTLGLVGYRRFRRR